MNDDLLGTGGLLGCIVLPVIYALAIGAKTKQQPSKLDGGTRVALRIEYMILPLCLLASGISF